MPIVTLTHLLHYELDGAPQADGLATIDGGLAATVFLPGRLPCGECAACRRGLVGACPAARPGAARPGLAVGDTLEVAERFLAPFAPGESPASLDGAEGPPLLPDAALLAGPVALVLQALAATSAVPGDVVAWLGDGRLCQLGADLSRARGLRAYRLEGGVSELAARIDEQTRAEQAVGARAHQSSSDRRHLVLTRTDGPTWAAASTLANPGASWVSLGSGPLRLPQELSLPAETRLVRLSAYHPDLLPEALATVRREPLPWSSYLFPEGAETWRLA